MLKEDLLQFLRFAAKGQAMRMLGIIVVCAMTFYVIDSIFFGGVYFAALRDMADLAASR